MYIFYLIAKKFNHFILERKKKIRTRYTVRFHRCFVRKNKTN